MPYVYEIQNLIDNKKYIGFCSKTPNKSLNYFGSGNLINRAIKKYGKENFQKIILKEFNNEYDARLYEEYLIRKHNAIADPMYYNLTKGGGGGFSENCKTRQKSIETREKISKSNTGRIVSEETRKKLHDKLKGTKPWNTGIPRSEETKRKLSEALKNKSLTEQHRKNISNAQKGKEYKISTCTHCGKSGGVNVMQRWHFDKCKLNSQINHV
jgi:group I intron endonuclease